MSGSHVPSQEKIDTAIINFVISMPSSLSLVESQGFANLMGVMQPSIGVISRSNIQKEIHSRHNASRDAVIKAMEKATQCDVTAYVWKGSHGTISFGVTAHWLDTNTRQMRNAALALKWFTGFEEDESLDDVLGEIFEAHGIDSKLGKVKMFTSKMRGQEFYQFFEMKSTEDSVSNAGAGDECSDKAESNHGGCSQEKYAKSEEEHSNREDTNEVDKGEQCNKKGPGKKRFEIEYHAIDDDPSDGTNKDDDDDKDDLADDEDDENEKRLMNDPQIIHMTYLFKVVHECENYDLSVANPHEPFEDFEKTALIRFNKKATIVCIDLT